MSHTQNGRHNLALAALLLIASPRPCLAYDGPYSYDGGPNDYHVAVTNGTINMEATAGGGAIRINSAGTSGSNMDGLDVGDTIPARGSFTSLSGGPITTTDHLISTAASPPTVSSCGTSPSVSGTDVKGVITTGSGGPTACTLNFATAYASAPVCVVSLVNSASIGHKVTATTASALTVGFTAGYSSQKFNYVCIQ